jgi:hypothetical protein
MSGLQPVNGPDDPPAWGGMGVVLYSTSAEFSAGTVGAMLRVNGGRVVATDYLDAHSVLGTVLTPLVNFAPAAPGEWTCTARDGTFSGLDHLNGEVAGVLGDGAVYANQTVAAGTVALDPPASLVAAGLPYRSVILGLPWESSRGLPSAGRLKRVDTLYLRLRRTMGCIFGQRVVDSFTGAQTDLLEVMPSRSAADRMDVSTPLFTGIKRLDPQGGHDMEGRIVVAQSDPVPLTVLAIGATGDVSEISP